MLNSVLKTTYDMRSIRSLMQPDYVKTGADISSQALQFSASMPMNAASLSPVRDFAENPTSLCSSWNADSTSVRGPANLRSSV